MDALFEGVANHHHLDVALVRQYRLSRDNVLDSGVILGFGVLYAIAAYHLAGRIRRRFPRGQWLAFLVATVAVSVSASALGVMLGDLWSVTIENLRLGSGHLSYRMDRIPWRHHRAELFVCGLVVFWLVAAVRSRVAVHEDGRLTLRGSEHAV